MRHLLALLIPVTALVGIGAFQQAGFAQIRASITATFPAVLFAEAPSGDGPPSDPGEEGDNVGPGMIGRLIPIQLPITGPSGARVKQLILRLIDNFKGQKDKLVFILRFDTNKGEEAYAARSEFGACYDLADFLTSESLSGIKTVAYIPYRAEGHAVLVIIACDEIYMAPEAEWGAAGIAERRITPPMQSAYRHIAERRRSIPVAVALGMLDPSRTVLQVETDTERLFVTPDELEQIRKTRTLRGAPSVVFPAGQLGRLTGRESRALDLISSTVADARELYAALGLRANLVQEERFVADHWRAVQVLIEGPITPALVERAQRLIEEARQRKDVNFVCVRINSEGGSPRESLKLASYLAADLDSEKVRTVAYIPFRALADAALIAVACDQIIMAPGALLGGEGNAVPTEDDLLQIRRVVREVIAKRTGRTWSLPLSLVDPNVELFRYVRKGMPDFADYMSEEEWAQLPDKNEWEKKDLVKEKGKPLQVDGAKAVEYGLSRDLVESFAEFKALYGLENDPALLEPTWVDTLLRALSSPYIAVLLLIIGGVALLVEVQTPGIGIGGFLAAVCFVLFFWSRFLGGTAGWLEVLLFLLGASCLLLEIFVLPGFGIFGLGGGLLIVASLVLASQTFIVPQNSYQWLQLQKSLLILLFAAIGIGVVLAFINRWLPKTPGLKHLMLAPPSENEAEDMLRRRSLLDIDESFVGQRGVAVTKLLPSGKARFGQRILDVISQDGDPIDPGTSVVVTEVRGNRVYVRPQVP